MSDDDGPDLQERTPSRHGRRPIDYRDPRLVRALLGVLYEADVDVDPKELETIFAGDLWTRATINRAINDLCALGAVRKVKPWKAPPRTVSKLRMTLLGRAWTDRRLEAYVGELDPPDPVEEPSTD